MAFPKTTALGVSLDRSEVLATALEPTLNRALPMLVGVESLLGASDPVDIDFVSARRLLSLAAAELHELADRLRQADEAAARQRSAASVVEAGRLGRLPEHTLGTVLPMFAGAEALLDEPDAEHVDFASAHALLSMGVSDLRDLDRLARKAADDATAATGRS